MVIYLWSTRWKHKDIYKEFEYMIMENRLARYSINRRVLSERLPISLPKEGRVQYIQYDYNTDSIVFVITHPKLEPIDDGGQIPQIWPELREVDYRWLKALLSLVRVDEGTNKEIQDHIERFKYVTYWPGLED